ncbi:hypothetical protein KM427_15320 [Nocardioides sp. LMS-CY]|uniref:hypothetical protein n=1 Tax=Nocardioides sp. (strain LMS-CY) TaxID=2840457 RepID=UPI001C003B3D|nr:hypothetical protein [Nocardioides sp. LMS-CY]QWF20352.1 hypothetical protein KM427_15320 [Nocardioides sp. LMS-CY]
MDWVEAVPSNLLRVFNGTAPVDRDNRTVDDTARGAGEFDPQALLDELERLSREKEAVAALRPSPKAMSKSLLKMTRTLYDSIELQRQISCLEAEKQPTQTYAWLARPGSMAQADFASFEPGVLAFVEEAVPEQHHWLATNPTRNPAEWSVDFLKRCVHTVIDDLSGLAVLMRRGEYIRAPLTLSRSVLEAASVGCFVTDSTVSSEERLRRGLNFHLAELRESANEVADRRDEFQYEEALGELIGFAEHAGFTVKRPRRTGSHEPPVILGPGRTRADSARVMVEQVLPCGVGISMWRSLSAVAHSRDSGTLLPDEYSLPHDITPWRRAESVAWHSITALLVAQELVKRLDPFLGWDLSGWASAFDAVVQQWAAGAGMADDRIRAHLGLE